MVLSGMLLMLPRSPLGCEAGNLSSGEGTSGGMVCVDEVASALRLSVDCEDSMHAGRCSIFVFVSLKRNLASFQPRSGRIVLEAKTRMRPDTKTKP